MFESCFIYIQIHSIGKKHTAICLYEWAPSRLLLFFLPLSVYVCVYVPFSNTFIHFLILRCFLRCFVHSFVSYTGAVIVVVIRNFSLLLTSSSVYMHNMLRCLRIHLKHVKSNRLLVCRQKHAYSIRLLCRIVCAQQQLISYDASEYNIEMLMKPDLFPQRKYVCSTEVHLWF